MQPTDRDVPAGEPVVSEAPPAPLIGGEGLAGRLADGSTGVLLAVLVALVLGALHSLEPGHGKTLVAAYFVASRGTPRQAIAFALLVTAAHTVGTAVIACLGFLAGDALLPARLLPWFGLLSGAVIVGLGASMLLELAMRSRRTAPTDGHSETGATLAMRRLLILGAAHGLLPTPTTIVVLLAAVSLGRIIQGVAVVVAFGVGFAVSLSAVALLALYGRRFVTDTGATGDRGRGWRRLSALVVTGAPVAAAFVLVASGLLVAIRSFGAI
jgi:ABC-type nickel/cobalt efflux system permease component RcnA